MRIFHTLGVLIIGLGFVHGTRSVYMSQSDHEMHLGGEQVKMDVIEMHAKAHQWPIDAEEWNFTPPPTNDSSHIIFDTVRSLLQHWTNTRYRNGHTIIPGVIPPGTLLYHGTFSQHLPTTPEWTSTDPEHALMFCHAYSLADPPDPAADRENGCWQLTLVSTRSLKVVYFDGNSAAKMLGGTMDSQDVLIWGRVREEKTGKEWERINGLCEWAREVGVDGFVRMEMDFEVMMCDFTKGVETVSFLNLVPVYDPALPLTLTNPLRPLATQLPGGRPRPGVPISIDARVLEAGAWHNTYPGETRVRLDYSRLVTFYDEDLAPLLARSRQGVPRLKHRIALGGNRVEAEEELARIKELVDKEVREWVVEVDSCAMPGKENQVDWKTLYATISQRYASRLELLHRMLGEKGTSAGRAQRHVRSMLAPFILHGAVLPASTTTALHNTSIISSETDHRWAIGILASCSTAHTASLILLERNGWTRLTRAERVLLTAARRVEGEICRVLVGMWSEGVEKGMGTGWGDESLETHYDYNDITREEGDEATLVARWHLEVTRLMEWLDWSAEWLRCIPACGAEEMCVLPTWPYFDWPRYPDAISVRRLRSTIWQRFKGDEGEEGDWRDPRPSCMRVVEPRPEV